MSLQGIRLEIGKSLRDITFKKCVAKCPGGVSGVGMAGGRRAQRSDSGEGRLLLCCREEIYPRRLSRSPRNLSPLFSHRDAHITFSRRCVRACVRACTDFRRNVEKTHPVLPGVFLCPVMTASPVTGCNQVVLFASSLLVKENGGGRGEQRTRKKTPNKNASEKKAVGIHKSVYPRHIYLMKNMRPSRVTP